MGANEFAPHSFRSHNHIDLACDWRQGSSVQHTCFAPHAVKEVANTLYDNAVHDMKSDNNVALPSLVINGFAVRMSKYCEDPILFGQSGAAKPYRSIQIHAASFSTRATSNTIDQCNIQRSRDSIQHHRPVAWLPCSGFGTYSCCFVPRTLYFEVG
jgi:hypothetical protein